MLDFWESMGRILTDPNLRKDLFTSPFTSPNQPVSCGIQISNAKYDALKRTLKGRLENAPVSVFTQGELLRVLPLPAFADSVGKMAVKTQSVGSGSGSGSFFVALGALSVDTPFRNDFRVFTSLSQAQDHFPRLVQQDFDSLRNLISAVDSGSFSELAASMCEQSWDPICFVTLKIYTTDPQQHPVLKASSQFLESLRTGDTTRRT